MERYQDAGPEGPKIVQANVPRQASRSPKPTGPVRFWGFVPIKGKEMRKGKREFTSVIAEAIAEEVDTRVIVRLREYDFDEIDTELVADLIDEESQVIGDLLKGVVKSVAASKCVYYESTDAIDNFWKYCR